MARVQINLLKTVFSGGGGGGVTHLFVGGHV